MERCLREITEIEAALLAGNPTSRDYASRSPTGRPSFAFFKRAT
jgi:hypothetical protein